MPVDGRPKLHELGVLQGQPCIEFEDVFHYYTRSNQSFEVVQEISFKVYERQFLAIVGPSGCGKTTLMNMVAGLVAPGRGRVLLNGREIDGIDKSRRIGYMLARDALLPWRSAVRNVEFALANQGLSRPETNRRAVEMLALVGLEGFEDSYPSQLSHGMRQRVAVARTLAPHPSILLMDEPFGALDAQTKLRVEEEFIRLWERERVTVIFVTHDLGEAIALADRVLVMSARPGQIKMDLKVNLPRPRDLESVRFDPEYVDLYQRLWSGLKNEG